MPSSCAQCVYVCIYVSLLQTKCAQYWSDAVAEPFDVGKGLVVTLQEVCPFADYEVKTFTLGEVSHYKIDVLYIRTYATQHFAGTTFSASTVLTSTHFIPPHPTPPHPPLRRVTLALNYTSTTSSTLSGRTMGSRGTLPQSSSLSRQCSNTTARRARHPWWCTAGGHQRLEPFSPTPCTHKWMHKTAWTYVCTYDIVLTYVL